MAFYTTTIASGASLSPEVAIHDGEVIVGIKSPAVWTTAALTFTACEVTGGTFYDLYDLQGNPVSIASGNMAAARYYAVGPTDYLDVRFLKLQSGTTSVPVNQGGTRTLIVITEPRR